MTVFVAFQQSNGLSKYSGGFWPSGFQMQAAAFSRFE
jgi:hypothetical protein